MTYACLPIQALDNRVQYLCSKHATALKNNSWNSCWRVWVELVQKIHLVWPPERVQLSFVLTQGERLGVGPATLVQGCVEVLYCNGAGESTGSEVFIFEWYALLSMALDAKGHGHFHEWQCKDQTHEAWLRYLVKQPVLQCLAAEPLLWKRGVTRPSLEDQY